MDITTMFIMNLLVPVIVLLVGLIMKIFPPKDRNGIYGYRTKMSRKSQETWDFSNRYSTKLMLILGAAELAASLVISYLLIKADETTRYYYSGIIATVEAILLLVVFIIVEYKMRKIFDDEGHRM